MRSKKHKVLFVTEAGQKIGLGHVKRCSNLTTYFKNPEEILFTIINPDRLLIPNSWLSNYSNFDDWVSLLSFLQDSTFSVIIIDVLGIMNQVNDFFRGKSDRLIYLGQSPEYCQFDNTHVINVAEGNGPHPSGSQFDRLLEGVSYFIPNPNLLTIKKKNKWTSYPGKVLIVFGGTDAASFSYSALDYFNTKDCESKLYIISKKLSKDVTSEKVKKNISVIDFCDQLIERLTNYDLVITSPGNLYFESLFLNIPSIAICQNPRQEEDFKNYPQVYRMDRLIWVFDSLHSIYDLQIASKPWNDMKPGKGLNEIIQLINGEKINDFENTSK